MKNIQICLSLALSLFLTHTHARTHTHTHTHATSSVTGLFSSLVFRVYFWSCVCACDPQPLLTVKCPAAFSSQSTNVSHCFWVRHTQPDPQRRGHVYTSWSISPRGHPQNCLSCPFLLPPSTCLLSPLRLSPVVFFPGTLPLLFFHLSSLNQHLFSFIHPVNLTPLRIPKDKYRQYLSISLLSSFVYSRFASAFPDILFHLFETSTHTSRVFHKPSVYAKCIQAPAGMWV